MSPNSHKRLLQSVGGIIVFGCLSIIAACGATDDEEGSLLPTNPEHELQPQTVLPCGNQYCDTDAGQSCCSHVFAPGVVMYQCVDKSTDPNNCGTCGDVCATGDTCCSGGCVDTSSDDNNCGGCGVVCAPLHFGFPTHCHSGFCY